MLLHLIGVDVSLLSFSKVLADFVVLLEWSHSLSVYLIGLTFYCDGDFLYLWVGKLTHVSKVWLFSFNQI